MTAPMRPADRSASAVEDAVEVIAGVFDQLPGQTENLADLLHELGIEAGVRAVDLDFERRVGKGRCHPEHPDIAWTLCRLGSTTRKQYALTEAH
jgi:hypothetical protein